MFHRSCLAEIERSRRRSRLRRFAIRLGLAAAIAAQALLFHFG